MFLLLSTPTFQIRPFADRVIDQLMHFLDLVGNRCEHDQFQITLASQLAFVLFQHQHDLLLAVDVVGDDGCAAIVRRDVDVSG